MEGLFQDVRYGLRLFWRAPSATLPILLALALGIGANTAMFSVIDAVVLRPLSYTEPSRLALLWEKDSKQVVYPVAGANFLAFREQAKSFEQVAGWLPQAFVLTGGDRPEQLRGGAVTANFFSTLGAKPVLGRAFLPEEDGLANPALRANVAILSYRFWQENFGSDQNVLGHLIRLNDQQYTVVGVMPQDFQFIIPHHALWVPANFDRSNRSFHNLTTIGRLRSGVGIAAAAQECASIAQRLGAEFPATNRGWTSQLDRLDEWLVQSDFRKTIYILEGAVVLVLLIACGNVANLLLARAAGRRREIAIRTAVGARRWRIFRQVLTESVMLSVLGGLLGLLLARWLVSLSPSILPPGTIPPTAPIRISDLVLWFTAGVSVLTGVLFGLAPALETSKTNTQETLRDGARGASGGTGARRLRSALVVFEVALATVLLAGSFLMLQSLNKMTSVDLGFRPERVLTFSVFLPASKYPAPQMVSNFYRSMTQKLESLPGVESVATASRLPLQRMTFLIPFELDGDPVRELGERPAVYYVTVDAGYLKTIGVPLKEGRAFESGDSEAGRPVVLVNEAFARIFYRGQPAAGRFVRINRPILGTSGFEQTVRAEIVGVMGDVKQANLSTASEPTMYVPSAQNVWSTTTMVAVRTQQDPESLIPAIRREIQSLDKDQPIDRVSTMDQSFNDFFAAPKFRTGLMGTFALLALALSILGIYSVNAYAVTQRRHEIGIRMAMGAEPQDILRMIIGRAVRETALGAAIGVAASIGLGSILRSLLFGVTATDPVALAGVSGVLAVVALVSGLLPALRAARVDPVIALRQP